MDTFDAVTVLNSNLFVVFCMCTVVGEEFLRAGHDAGAGGGGMLSGLGLGLGLGCERVFLRTL